MKKIIIVIISVTTCFLLAIASYFLSKKITSQLVLRDIENKQNSTSKLFFCATEGCSSLGVPATIIDYDSQTKEISISIQGDGPYTVTLTDTVKIDVINEVSYFEDNWMKGDDIYVVYKIASSRDHILDATDIYLVKTGVFTKLNLIK